MKALVFEETGKLPVLKQLEMPQAINSGKVVDVLTASLNHRDVWITQGLYPGLRAGTIMGSCACVRYEGEEYLVNPNNNWGPDPEYPDHSSYSIMGMPENGTFAEHICINTDRLVRKPEHLTAAEAAAIPLAGLTAWRALFSKGNVKPGDKVFISGVGGGVAIFAFQFAVAMGADVYVSSGSESKIRKALAFGAKAGVNYNEPDWHKSFVKKYGQVDVIIDSAGGEGYGRLLYIAAPRARVVNYGGTLGKAVFSPQHLFWKELELKGSTMGNDKEFIDMIRFIDSHKIIPIVDEIFTLEDYPLAFDKMQKGSQMGKIILEISS